MTVLAQKAPDSAAAPLFECGRTCAETVGLLGVATGVGVVIALAGVVVFRLWCEQKKSEKRRVRRHAD